MIDASKRKSPFVRSAEMQALLDRLQSMPVGALLSLKELGADSKEAYRATERLRRDGAGVWKRDGDGLRRLSAGEVVDVAAPSYIEKSRRAATRARESLVLVEYAELTDAQKSKLNVSMGVAAALTMATSIKARNAIRKAIGGGPALPGTEVLALFGKLA